MPNEPISIDTLLERLDAIEQRVNKLQQHFDKIDFRIARMLTAMEMAGQTLAKVEP